jgi:hypothetical protein
MPTKAKNPTCPSAPADGALVRRDILSVKQFSRGTEYIHGVAQDAISGRADRHLDFPRQIPAPVRAYPDSSSFVAATQRFGGAVIPPAGVDLPVARGCLPIRSGRWAVTPMLSP